MKISCVINHVPRTFDVEPDTTLREMLVAAGHVCVRDSDDREGFCGSDTIGLSDGTPVYANLMAAAWADGSEILTPDGLGDLQASFRRPAGHDRCRDRTERIQCARLLRLLLTWLLDHNPDPTREDIKDALSGIYIRDASYEHYYLAVKLVTEKRKSGHYISKTAPTVPRSSGEIGTPDGKVDGPAPGHRTESIRGGLCLPGMPMRHGDAPSPYASAYIKSIDIGGSREGAGGCHDHHCKELPGYLLYAGRTGQSGAVAA